MPDEIDLNPEEESALDRVWEQRRAALAAKETDSEEQQDQVLPPSPAPLLSSLP